MADPVKLHRLQQLHDQLAAGKITPALAAKLTVRDTDGQMVALSHPDALAAIARRIAQEQAG